MSVGDLVGERWTRIFHQLPTLSAIPRYVYKVASILLFLGVWWFFVAIGFLGFDLIPTPIESITALIESVMGEPLTSNGDTLYTHSYHTFVRVGLGITLGIVTAIPLGLLIGWSNIFDAYLFPAFEVLRPIPPVAWVPIALIMFTTELMSIVWVVFVGVFFPILINTIDGVREIETDYIRAIYCLGGNKFDLFRHVIVPATIPSIVTGTITGIGIGWIAVVAAEMLSGNYGIGYATYQAYRLMNTQTVIIGIITLGIYGAVSSLLISHLGKRLTPWERVES